jgi:hypothetical protein
MGEAKRKLASGSATPLFKYDRRGYPIPFTTKHMDGQPMFNMVDGEKVKLCLDRQLCSICGKRMSSELWFVGSPAKIFHDNVAFSDPPMHYGCAILSVTTCPYLMNNKFVQRLKTTHEDLLAPIPTLDLFKPEFFGVAMAGRLIYSPQYGIQNGTLTNIGFTILPDRPFKIIEFWKNGQKIDTSENWEIAKVLAAQEYANLAELDD